jgi:tol-pal system protein YbgF
VLLCRLSVASGLAWALLFGSSFVESQDFKSQTPAPSAESLYSNGERDITAGKYDLARQEFQDYLEYYGDTELASNARFYLGEIAYLQKNYQNAVNQYSLMLTDYPKSSRLIAAHYKKGLALIELGQRTTGIRELRDVVRRFPGTDEERHARAKLIEMGIIP